MTRTSGIDDMTVAQHDHWRNQPRVPRGDSEGGQWTDEGAGGDVKELSTQEPEKLPELKKGEPVIIDGHRGIVTKISRQNRTALITSNELDPSAPTMEETYKVTTVTIENDWGGIMKFQFGGLDYFHSQRKRERMK